MSLLPSVEICVLGMVDLSLCRVRAGFGCNAARPPCDDDPFRRYTSARRPQLGTGSPVAMNGRGRRVELASFSVCRSAASTTIELFRLGGIPDKSPTKACAPGGRRRNPAAQAAPAGRPERPWATSTSTPSRDARRRAPARRRGEPAGRRGRPDGAHRLMVRARRPCSGSSRRPSPTQGGDRLRRAGRHAPVRRPGRGRVHRPRPARLGGRRRRCGPRRPRYPAPNCCDGSDEGRPTSSPTPRRWLTGPMSAATSGDALDRSARWPLGIPTTGPVASAHHLSGGEQKRMALEALLRGPDEVLLLDEADNFLDVPAKRWPRGAAWECGKTILFVSHDRELLDKGRDPDRYRRALGRGAAGASGGFKDPPPGLRLDRNERSSTSCAGWDENMRLRTLMLMYSRRRPITPTWRRATRPRRPVRC